MLKKEPSTPKMDIPKSLDKLTNNKKKLRKKVFKEDIETKPKISFWGVSSSNSSLGSKMNEMAVQKLGRKVP